MKNIIPVIVTTVGLVCDIYGAWLVAVEVRKVFEGQITFHVSAIAGGKSWTNPEFVKHEQDKHKTMKRGLFFLFAGFILQIIGFWIPVFY